MFIFYMESDYKGIHSLKVQSKRNRKTMQLLNIVLLHNQYPESYVKLFEGLLEADFVVDLKGDKHIELLGFRKMRDVDMYEGYFVTYMDIRPDAWFNPESKEIESRYSDSPDYGNAKRCNFYFIPSRHKLALLSGSDITIQHIKTYMECACNRLLGGGKVHVNYVTKKDDIKDAYDNLNVTRVRLTLNYSNKDFTEDFEKSFDDAAKKGNVSLINMELIAADNESLNMEDGSMTDSLLNLATKLGNGDADITGIEIIQPKGKQKKVRTKNHRIRTSDYIQTFKIAFNNLFDLPFNIYNEVMNHFKQDD